MFKKTLVAASLLAAFSASAINVDYDTAAKKYNAADKVSIEGNAVSTTLGVNTFDVVLEAATYLADDQITFTFTGGELDFASPLPTLAIVSGDDKADNSGNSNAATLTLVTANATSATYKIAAITAALAGDTFVGSKIVVGNDDFIFDASTLEAATSVKVTAKRGTTDLDNKGNDNPTLFTKAAQFKGEVKTALNAVVDVNALRLTFEGTAVSDTLVTTFTNNSSYENAATASAVNYEVAGDFSFLDTDADKDGIQVGTGKVTVDDLKAGSLKVEADKISWVDDTPVTGDTTLTIDVSDDDGKAAAEAIATQDFTVSAEVVYGPVADTDAVTDDLLAGSAGSWTLNGADVHVPFMPFRTGYAQSITVSNSSEQDGAIEVVMYSGGEKYSKVLTETAKPQAVTDISSALIEMAVENSLAGADVSFDIIVNAPSKEIEVIALYYKDGDRLRTK